MSKKLTPKLEEQTHPARLWVPDPKQENRVTCHLSPRHCSIGEGGLGFCGVRRNIGGKLVTLNYGKSVEPTEEVIETEAVFHFSPGERILSLGNIGCMMACDFCQNWQTSQARLARDKDISINTPEQVVEMAEQLGIRVLSWTYNDPVVWHEFVTDTARLAQKKGIMNLYKSAFYIGPEAIAELVEVMDIFSISLKAMSEEFYLKHTGGRLQPVLDGIKQVYASGKHLELSNLMVTGRNDNLEESAKIAKWMMENLNENIPLHYVRFHPDYKYNKVERTDIAFMEKARQQAKDIGLKNVYLGNVSESEALNTVCSCGEILVKRFGLRAEMHLKEGKCAKCGADAGIKLLPKQTRVTDVPSEIPFTSHVDHVWDADRLSVHIEVSDGAPVFYQPLGTDGKPLNGFRMSAGKRLMVSRSHPKEHTLRVFYEKAEPRILALMDRAYFPVR
jgi:pyruvate formate lyase activating enzyme